VPDLLEPHLPRTCTYPLIPSCPTQHGAYHRTVMPSTNNLSSSPNLTIAYNLLLASGAFLHSEKPTKIVPLKLISSELMSNSSPIACLESYINPSLPIGTSLHIDATSPALHLLPSSTLSKLKNVGSSRVRDMRSLGQSKQVLSHIPITANAATCTRFNDALFSGIHLNADKLVALAILPADGKEAARELQRCVTKMNFVGGVLGLRPDGKGGVSLGTELEELWTIANTYRVPIMLRDMWPVGGQVCSLVPTMLRNR
jgi:predicted TIM-barrel fold metal-dependent hydrolase